MKVSVFPIFCILLCLFSCKSTKEISSMVLMSHLHGDIYSTTVSNYSDWDFDKQEGIGLLYSVKTSYDPKGYITKVEQTTKNGYDSIASKVINYKYDSKQHLIETETIFLDSIGEVKKTQNEKLINSVNNANTWKVEDDIEVRTFDNDTESIVFLTDSGTVEAGLVSYKKYSTSGQLLNKRISSNHIALIDSYEYNPISGFLFKEKGDQNYRFSEMSISNTYIYAYIDTDEHGNWKLRIRFNEDKQSNDIIYQSQQIYYRK